MSTLCGILVEISEEVSLACAYKLAEIWGGISVYVPKLDNLKPDHPFVIHFGKEDAQALCTMFGGENIKVPFGQSTGPSKKTQINTLRQGNGKLTVRAIARKAGTTESWASRVLNAGKPPANQGDLF